MKRLRVVLVCLIVALLCWYPSRHVDCSEQSAAGPVQSAQDSSPQAKPEEGAHEKVEEDWAVYIQSYDVGLESERVSLEAPAPNEMQDEEDDETVKKEEPVVEARTEPATDPAPDPESDPPASQDQQAPPTAAASSPPTELPAAVPAEQEEAPEDTPTSQAPPTTPTSAIEVASADTPVDSSIDAEHQQSASECEAAGPPVAPPPFRSPLASLTVDHVENSSSTHGSRTGTKTELDSSLPHVEQDVPELDQGTNASHMPEEEAEADEAPVAKETDPSVPGKEDIPTFDEWKKKVMEVEKEKSQSMHSSSNGSPHVVKKVQKNFKNNYASVECGAKILSANTEAKSTSAILMENMDLYMLNPCSNKIWFVIELCEPIQVKQLDIANFELFSSTPKDFLVSISDRYPTNKWIKLGTFHARDERTVQSFPLDEQLYAKYVKVELLSHFGSEHFCPLSLIRVFGTSMVEEYEEIAESQYPSERLEYLDEDYDYPPGYVPAEDKAAKNLLGSATNAILTMVNNIAANVLGAKPELEEGANVEANFSTDGENVTEPSPEEPASSTPSPSPSSPSPSPEEESPELEVPVATEEPEAPPPEAPTPAPPEETLIVTLVEEDEEEPRQSTVTLLEGEEEEEEAEAEERRRTEERQRESRAYSGELSSLSCAASLREYLLRWCSASLALQRQRSERQRQREARADARSPPQPLPLAPTPTLEPPLDTEPPPEAERPTALGEGAGAGPGPGPTDAVLEPARHADAAAERTAEPPQLEPSQTAALPPHSFPVVTPTEEIPRLSALELPELELPLSDGVPETQAEARRRLPSSSDAGPSSSGGGSPGLAATSVSSAAEPATPETDAPRQDLPAPASKEPPVQPLPTATRPAEIPPPTELPAPAEPEGGRAAPEEPSRAAPPPEHPEAAAPPAEPRAEESVEDVLLSVASGGAQLHRTATDFYAELQNSTELGYGNGNGNQVHGSNQKESVFMRLNNRIKALEMNMSLSSRYLEELSQRYRKQMEEMQRAFNKTIIKLQNTSRIAEEQDQKQTESIQVLQSQLENLTQLVFNLSTTVSQLQREVSDRQSFLVVSLLLCLCLGLLLCIQCCRSSTPPPPDSTASIPKSNHYPSPKRCFSSYDDMSLKRRVSCPLVRSKSFQLPTTEVGPDDLYIVEPLRFSPEKKKKRCKMKVERVETLKPSAPAPAVANGGPKCNGVPPPHAAFLSSGEAGASSSKDPTSEGSSEGSSHSDESYFCGISTCSRLCNGHPPPRTRTEKRAIKRRRSKMLEQGRYGGEALPGRAASMPTLEDLMKGNKDMSVGTFGVTAVTGHV
ncbi:SUN domain-containing ossification factor isoform X2 [Anguilla rostrata]|uniref:SUN domain-containing ossification factor isoform X2 n=1 Tax=Anguilla rostrata TaxID=7938 RepID=UPI0030CAE135